MLYLLGARVHVKLQASKILQENKESVNNVREMRETLQIPRDSRKRKSMHTLRKEKLTSATKID